ncbi:MAG: hypothetical protein ACKOHM_05755 [Spartobacteria bacterium]
MILELLEWCLTPASLRARSTGLLAGQIAIRHRSLRCRHEWQPHLECCKNFLRRNLISGKHVAVLGSGHLRDIDLRHLKKHFARISLVDVVHPLEVRLLAMFSRGRIRLLSGDLSGALHLKRPASTISLEKNLRSSLEEADTLVSACLLSQLALPFTQRWSGRFSEQEISQTSCLIGQMHLGLLKNAKQSLLMTDSAQRYGNDDWIPLLPGLDLPPAHERWIWDIATAGEHGLKGLGDEQRLVEASLFQSLAPAKNHENLCPFELKQ